MITYPANNVVVFMLMLAEMSFCTAVQHVVSILLYICVCAGFMLLGQFHCCYLVVNHSCFAFCLWLEGVSGTAFHQKLSAQHE
jgi:hypothetical protein